MNWAVLCDFDHTITTEDVTDTLLAKYALPEWKHVEALWETGAIGSNECMRQQIAMLRASPAQVDEVASTIHIDPHFKSFVTMCENKHVPLVVVSDGLDYVIRHILKREDLGHLSVIASHLNHIENDRWELTTPFASAGCDSQASTCKCAVSQQIRTMTDAEKILYIGDGRSDFCVSLEEADMIFAKESLLAYCQKQQLPHKPFANFLQATQWAEELIQPQKPRLPEHAKEAMYA